MLTRCVAATALALAGCVAAPPPTNGVAIQVVAGRPEVVRVLLDKEQSFRLSRVGIMDPSSPSGLTDRIRYRAALEGYMADVLRAHRLCPRGHGEIDVAPAQPPYATVISVACSAP